MILLIYVVIFLLFPVVAAVAKLETERQLRETARVLELTIARRGPDSEEWRQFFAEMK